MSPEFEPSPTSQAPAHPVSLPQLAIVAAFIVGYALLSHYANTAPGAKGLGAALTIAPIVLIGGVMLWRWTHPVLAPSVFAVVGVLLVYYWPVLTKYYEWADVGLQCGAYALVSLTFGRSLWGGRVPVCTQLTAKLHGPLTPAEITYTRWATRVWTVIYALLAVVILVLFFVTSLRIWSLFVNVGVFVLIALAFIADHTLRRYVLPHRPGGILAAVRQSLTGSG